jgi:ribonuclease D
MNLVGIDIEHFSSNSESFICLIQIATLEQVFLIDCFNQVRQEIDHFLLWLFSHPQKIKVLHSYDNDLKWLCEDYSVSEFRNILDTARVFTLSDEHHKSHTPSLKWLAENYLKFPINK